VLKLIGSLKVLYEPFSQARSTLEYLRPVGEEHSPDKTAIPATTIKMPRAVSSIRSRVGQSVLNEGNGGIFYVLFLIVGIIPYVWYWSCWICLLKVCNCLPKINDILILATRAPHRRYPTLPRCLRVIQATPTAMDGPPARIVGVNERSGWSVRLRARMLLLTPLIAGVEYGSAAPGSALVDTAFLVSILTSEYCVVEALV